MLLAKTVLALGALMMTMPLAEAHGGFRGGGGFGGGGFRGGGFRGGGFRGGGRAVIVAPSFGYGYGYPGFGLGYGYGPYGYGFGPYGYGGYGFGYSNPHPDQGKLKIKVDKKEKNAQVFLDGAFAGNAKDMKSTWLKEGTYDLEVHGVNGATYSSQIYVTTGKTITIQPNLVGADFPS